jgi:hypothetical protein
MLDRERGYPPEMPVTLREDLAEQDLTAIRNWAAFTHQGM